MTYPSFGGWSCERCIRRSSLGMRLSAPASLETLAVVGYRTTCAPLPKWNPFRRRVQCGEMLRQLMDRDLVRIVGKSHDLGRPLLYGTTPRFLQVFGLRHLDDLPRAQQLRPTADASATSEVISKGNGRDLGSHHKFPRPERGAPHVTTSLEHEFDSDWLSRSATALALDVRAHAKKKDDDDDLDDEEEEVEDDDDEVDDDEEDEEDDEDGLEEDEDWEEVDDEDEDWDDDDDDDEDDWDDDDEDEDEDEEESNT